MTGILRKKHGAEQGERAEGFVQRRRRWVGTKIPEQIARSYCEAVMTIVPEWLAKQATKPSISYCFNNDTDNDGIMTNNDGKIPSDDTDNDNIEDGTEDVNNNGRIDGDNGDGIWSESETWTELNPNNIDTDGDSFSDSDEQSWGYNPISKDTDGDGLNDNVEDHFNYGTKDSNETSVIESDTDKDGLSDKMELDGWTVIVIYEATLEIKEEYDVTSDPLDSDSEDDGINDCGEFENGTDPNEDDTDGDGFTDKYEIEHEIGSSPTGIDGTPPTITDFKSTYDLELELSGPWNNIDLVTRYVVRIEISAADVFGVQWINVHIGGVGSKRIYTGNVTEVNGIEFEFTLGVDQAVRSLFNNFSLNISGSDDNNNIGFKEYNAHSISNIIFESITSEFEKISSILKEILNPFQMIESYIIKILSSYIDPIIEKIIYKAKYFLKLFENVLFDIEKRDEHIILAQDYFYNNILSIVETIKTVFTSIYNLVKPYAKYLSNLLNMIVETVYLVMKKLINLVPVDENQKQYIEDNINNIISFGYINNIVENIFGWTGSNEGTKGDILQALWIVAKLLFWGFRVSFSLAFAIAGLGVNIIKFINSISNGLASSAGGGVGIKLGSRILALVTSGSFWVSFISLILSIMSLIINAYGIAFQMISLKADTIKEKGNCIIISGILTIIAGIFSIISLVMNSITGTFSAIIFILRTLFYLPDAIAFCINHPYETTSWDSLMNTASGGGL